MQRNPPEYVCKILRKEVNYGCPICGSPFLTWHHFDPPWRERQHHNPEGMIALCAEHAQKADGCNYTKDQLKSYKENPVVKDMIKDHRWPWEPEKLVFLIGGSVVFGVRPLLTLRGKEIFGATREWIPGRTTKSIFFNFNLVDPNGNPIVDMKKNWLTIHTSSIADLKLTTRSTKFVVSHDSGLKLSICFHRYLLQDFQEHLWDVAIGNKAIIEPSVELSKKYSTDSDGLIPVVTLTGTLFNKDVTMKIQKKAIKVKAHFFQNERVIFKPRLYFPPGSINIVLEGQGEIMKFG